MASEGRFSGFFGGLRVVGSIVSPQSPCLPTAELWGHVKLTEAAVAYRRGTLNIILVGGG